MSRATAEYTLMLTLPDRLAAAAPGLETLSARERERASCPAPCACG
jgi:hypothetical protein